MVQDIEIPGGGGKKLPGWVLLAGGAVIVLILLMKKGGGEDEGDYDTNGLLSSEMNQRLQEMQEALQQALDNAQEQAPIDQTEPPSRPINPRPPFPRPEMPPDDGLHPVPFPRDETPAPGTPAPRPTRPPRPGGDLPPTPGIPPTTDPTRPGRTPAPEGETVGLPPRSTTAILGTRTGHESRIRFIEEAGDSAAGIHKEAKARHEKESPTLNITNIANRTTAAPTRKKELEKRSPILKSTTKKIVKQAPSAAEKMKPSRPKGRKR